MKKVCRSIKHYFQHDFKEIILPSSLPNPPGYTPPPPVTWSETVERLRKTFTMYLDTWNKEKLKEHMRKHGIEVKDDDAQDIPDTEELKALKSEIQKTMRSGPSAIGPYLKYLYKTRAVAYQQAVKEFIVGYREGFKEAQNPSNKKES